MLTFPVASSAKCSSFKSNSALKSFETDTSWSVNLSPQRSLVPSADLHITTVSCTVL